MFGQNKATNSCFCLSIQNLICLNSIPHSLAEIQQTLTFILHICYCVWGQINEIKQCFHVGTLDYLENWVLISKRTKKIA